MPIDPRVEELIASEHLEEAATLAEHLADFTQASKLFERAALFARAAEAALLAGEPARALRLAARAPEDDLIHRAALALAPAAREDAARDLETRRLHRPAAIVHDCAGDVRAAGRCWELAGEPVLAAARLVSASETRGAARVLSSHLRAHPEDAAAALSLARILLAHGSFEAAAATLQKLDTSGPHADEARALLSQALGSLGLEPAADVVPAPLADAQPAEHPLLFGRYEILRTVATTPTARVMEATDRVSGRRAAIKLFRAGSGGIEGLDAIARFERESQALARLHHPHVVPLLAYIPEGPAVVLAWMGGGSLADALSVAALVPAHAVEIACALLSALEESHRMGILHRDVKPSNVLFDDSGSAHLGDFGAAHVSESATTVTIGLIGSLAYMAPEQRAGHQASVSSDLFGVGAMLYESMTGERPRVADELTVLPSAIYPDLDQSHDRLVLSLLAREPSARPENALAARKALESLPWRVSTEAPSAHASTVAALPTAEQRLRNLASGTSWDALIERNVRVVASTPEAVAMARAFARADHESLATIYRIDAPSAAIWVEAPRLSLLAISGNRLTPRARAKLREALSLLHAEGTSHGSIDAAHVHQRGDDVVLAFPQEVREDATAEADIAALARL